MSNSFQKFVSTHIHQQVKPSSKRKNTPPEVIPTLIHDLRKKNKFTRVLILISFFTTFVMTRIVTHLQKANILPNQHGSFHLHHLVPGIIITLISGYFGISYWSDKNIRKINALLFGMGAALTIDEFALWLFLKDNYWSKQGRDSIDAVILTISLLLLSLVISELQDHAWFTTIRDKIFKRKISSPLNENTST